MEKDINNNNLEENKENDEEIKGFWCYVPLITLILFMVGLWFGLKWGTEHGYIQPAKINNSTTPSECR